MGTDHYFHSDSERRRHGVEKMVVCPRFHYQISFLSWPSSSAWLCAFTSRRRIFSAPATASAATCSLSISLARAICWSMSALAAARMRSASAFAAAFASSIICASRLSAEAMTSPTRSRAFASSSCARLPASSSSRLPCSPAARPSAICFWRCSIARISGGQMNLTVNQMNSAKASACAIRVRVRFMCGSWRSRPAPASGSRHLAAQRAEQRVGEREEHADPEADDERGVDQAEQQEHLGLQRRDHLRLARRALEEAAAHDAHAHAGAERAQPDHKADSHPGVGLDEGDELEFFHYGFPFWSFS